jgi:hypothetical protein
LVAATIAMQLHMTDMPFEAPLVLPNTWPAMSWKAVFLQTVSAVGNFAGMTHFCYVCFN